MYAAAKRVLLSPSQSWNPGLLGTVPLQNCENAYSCEGMEGWFEKVVSTFANKTLRDEITIPSLKWMTLAMLSAQTVKMFYSSWLDANFW